MRMAIALPGASAPQLSGDSPSSANVNCFREICLRRTVGIRDVDLKNAVPIGDQNNLRSVGRPVGPEVLGMQDRRKLMLGRTTPSSEQARPPKHERESTAAPASEQEAKEASDLYSALARWEDEGGSGFPLTEP